MSSSSAMAADAERKPSGADHASTGLAGVGNGATATGYPYPYASTAPPPPAAHNMPYYYATNQVPPAAGPPYYPSYPQNVSYYPPPDQYYNSGIFFRRLLTGMIICFVVAGIATFIIWLVLRPRVPEFTLSSASVSNFNLSLGSTLSTDFHLDYTVNNPNTKLQVHYYALYLGAFYESANLVSTSLPPFDQNKQSSTTIPARLVAASAFVGNDGAKIDAERKSASGEVKFSFRIVGVVYFNSGIWRTRRHELVVYCKDVSFGLGTASNGTMIRPPKQCFVSI